MLKDRVILITGASRGIGRAAAIECGKRGATVIVNYNEHRQSAEEVVEIINKTGRALAIKADVRERTEVKSIFKTIRKEYGRLDVLVNNAGVIRNSLLLMTSMDDFDYVVDTNLRGSFICMQLAAKMMMKEERGKIINISSIVGRYGNDGQIAYAASKAGVIGMTLAAARELGQFGITVNVVAPGFIDTDMISNVPTDIREKLINSISLQQRLGTPADVANVIVFLSSDLSDYVSGQVIGVDGCQVM